MENLFREKMPGRASLEAVRLGLKPFRVARRDRRAMSAGVVSTKYIRPAAVDCCSSGHLPSRNHSQEMMV